MNDTFLQLELTRPWMLLGLALALPLVAFYHFRTLIDFTRAQRWISLACRIIIVLLLVLALGGLALLTTTTDQFVVLVVDGSLSIGPEARESAQQFVSQCQEHGKGHQLAYLAFARHPKTVTEEFDAESLEFEDAQSKGTSLAAALEVAAAAIPPFYVPQIVLLTDGNETDGDVLQTSLSSRVPISTVPLKTRDEPEVQVSSVNVPAQVRQGEPFYVEVVVDSNHDDEGYVEVYRGDIRVGGDEQPKRQKLKKGENRFRIRQTIDDENQVEFAVRIRGFDDQLLDNNEATGLVFASGRPRILLVASDTRQTDHLRWALQEQDVVVQVRPAEGMPRTLSELQQFDAVILANIPATQLSMKQMDVVRTYVQDLGGGLIMLGGDQSFGLGGYYKTVLEEILPVRSNFEKEKEKPSMSMVLIIDKSGSMGGMKIELAKDAAKSAVELLGARDKVGVIAFDGASYWVSEIHSASDKGFVIDRISTIEASGGTSMYPPMVDAYESLNATVSKLKHVILLTDGHSSPGDFEGITRDMAAARMTVSTVAVGNGADQDTLQLIAQEGNGRYYFCDDPQNIPQIFAKETVTASKSAINELPFVPQLVRPTQVLSGIELQAAPFLLGYVVTRPKPTCEFILASEAGDPLLCWWRYGLGMTVAFTSDASSRWAAEWLSWPDFGVFWAQVIRSAMRKNDTKGGFVEIHRQEGRATVSLDAVDESGQFVNDAVTQITLVKPSLKTQNIVMQQTAPGRYLAELDTSTSGTFHLELSQQRKGREPFQQTRGLVVGYADELRLRPTNNALLENIAQLSGGQYDPSPQQVFDIGDRTASRATPLWPYLLMVAAAIFLADVALRRIDFSLFARV